MDATGSALVARLADPIERLEKEVARLKQELEKVVMRENEGDEQSENKRRRDGVRDEETIRLPDGVWVKIAEKIDRNDVFAFAMTCKQLREAQQVAGRKLETNLGRRERVECEGLATSSFTYENLDFSHDWVEWNLRRYVLSSSLPLFPFFSADSRSSWCSSLNTTATKMVLLRGFVTMIVNNNYVDLLKFFPGGSTLRDLWYERCRMQEYSDNLDYCEDRYFQVTLRSDSVSEEVLRWLRDTGAELGRKLFFLLPWITASSDNSLFFHSEL